MSLLSWFTLISIVAVVGVLVFLFWPRAEKKMEPEIPAKKPRKPRKKTK